MTRELKVGMNKNVNLGSVGVFGKKSPRYAKCDIVGVDTSAVTEIWWGFGCDSVVKFTDSGSGINCTIRGNGAVKVVIGDGSILYSKLYAGNSGVTSDMLRNDLREPLSDAVASVFKVVASKLNNALQILAFDFRSNILDAIKKYFRDEYGLEVANIGCPKFDVGEDFEAYLQTDNGIARAKQAAQLATIEAEKMKAIAEAIQALGQKTESATENGIIKLNNEDKDKNKGGKN